jgi:hypothetical protein
VNVLLDGTSTSSNGCTSVNGFCLQATVVCVGWVSSQQRWNLEVLLVLLSRCCNHCCFPGLDVLAGCLSLMPNPSCYGQQFDTVYALQHLASTPDGFLAFPDTVM